MFELTCLCGNKWNGTPGDRCPECGRVAVVIDGE